MPRIAVVLAIFVLNVLVLSDRCSGEDPQQTSTPKNRTELFKMMIRMLGDSDVSVSERHGVENILCSIDDRALIPVLIEALGDERVFDPSMEVPSGNGQKAVYLVNDICSILLKSRFGISPRSLYRVTDWKEWWKQHESMSEEEIRTEIRDAEAKAGR